MHYLSNSNTGAPDGLDLLLGALAEELSLDDDWLVRETPLTEHLEVTRLGHVNHWNLSLGLDLLLLVLGAGLLGHEGPEAVKVDHGAEVLVVGLVEVAHANLPEVSRMVFVEVDTVVMLATSVTATTRVLAVLADTTLTVGNVSASLTALLQSGCHSL